jgi:BirA family biotin operon repressor/biotin-[acetyl-CoA-carboxylase] ligase
MNEQLLKLFRERPEQYISGEELSRTLNCSRTAVWKHIQALRGHGYEFESASRRGYRLVRMPDRLNSAAILSGLRTNIMGRRLHIFDSVESTQTTAQRLVAEGAGEGTLVLAEQQTIGRGRMGRSWHSPEGKGVWMSLVLFPQIPLPFTPQLTLLTAVAVCRAIRRLVSVNVGIKWPNDLLIEGKKVCGILLESKAEDERLLYIVAGIGISANLSAGDYPEHLQNIATSLLIESGRAVDRNRLVGETMAQFEDLYGLYRQEGFEPIRLLWEALSVTLGRSVRIPSKEGSLTGTAQGIDEMGALVVRLPDGEIRKIYSGDIVMQ